MSTTRAPAAKAEVGEETRTIEQRIELPARPDEVWQALTDARELMRWFPIEARVTPGVGGSIFYKWGDYYSDSSEIEVWEPPSHLRTTFGAPVDEQGKPKPLRTWVDYHIEARPGGGTTLRLVHTGFGSGGDWDGMYDGVRCGWRSEMRSLRMYLAQHKGKDRGPVWVIAKAKRGVHDAWNRIVGEGCLGLRNAGDLKPGDEFRAEGPAGPLTGGVLLCDEPRQLVASLDQFGGSFFRIELDATCAGEPSAWLWLSTWGVGAKEVEALDRKWNEVMKRLFGG
jgi:uncharacterized protein YndB with AHSA1/START domain